MLKRMYTSCCSERWRIQPLAAIFLGNFTLVLQPVVTAALGGRQVLAEDASLLGSSLAALSCSALLGLAASELLECATSCWTCAELLSARSASSAWHRRATRVESRPFWAVLEDNCALRFELRWLRLILCDMAL